MRIFLAGATGIIGRRLIPRLVSAGHDVTGTARSEPKAEAVRALGANAVLVDVLDRARLEALVVAAKPEVVIHQLTSLPDQLGPELQLQAVQANAFIRSTGTLNLIGAALQAGARRLVAQSVAWLYATGPLPHPESDALDVGAQGARAITVGGVTELERLVLNAFPIEGVVLRFGYLYGPDTWYAEPTSGVSLHVDAAVTATLLAVRRGAPGAYNVVDDGGSADNTKARRELGWDPSSRSS